MLSLLFSLPLLALDLLLLLIELLSVLVLGLLQDLLLLVFIGGFLVVDEEIRIHAEELTTCSELSLVLTLLLLLCLLLDDLCFLLDPAILLPLQEDLVCDQWT